MILIQISIGELVDKITILELKIKRIEDRVKTTHARKELDILEKALQKVSIDNMSRLIKLKEQLLETNGTLWTIEDDIRDCESGKDFGPRFVDLARSVYKINDQRFKLKDEINRLCNSEIVEVKSYKGLNP